MQINKSYCRYKDGRLIFYRGRPDINFWETLWKESFTEDLYSQPANMVLGELYSLFLTWLPKNGKILEAGCGMGQVVSGLINSGYDIEGVEWAPQIVEKIKTTIPEFPIRVGDVTKLDVPDHFYSGYISLGVMEHRIEGPQLFLNECFRILEPGGIACISVPAFNGLRSLKARLGFYSISEPDLDFYQYAFSRKEFASFLEKAGFEVHEIFGYGVCKGFKDECPLFRTIFNMRGVGWRSQLWLKNFSSRWKWFNQFFCHMDMYVVKKVKK